RQRRAEARAEATARDAHATRRRLEDFLSAGSDWFWETDAELRFNWFSEQALGNAPNGRGRSYGTTREEIAHTDYNPAGWAEYQRAVADRRPFKNFEYRRDAGDAQRWVRVSGVPAFDQDGVFLGYRGVGTDITKEVLAEQSASRDRIRLAAAIEQLEEGFSLWDEDDRLVLCNAKFRKLNSSYKESFDPGKRFEDFVRAGLRERQLPDAYDDSEAWFEKRMAYHREANGEPMVVSRVDGSHVLVQEQRLPDGHTVTIALDITDRHRAEQAAIESEALLESVFDNLPVGLVIKDLDQRVIRVNSAFCGWYGIVRSEIENGPPNNRGFSRDSDWDEMLAREREVAQTGRIHTRMVDRRFADGEIHSMRITKFPVRDAEGRIVKVGSVSIDLTDLVAAEAEAGRSEALLQSIFDNLPVGLVIKDVDHKVERANRAYRDWFGLGPTDTVPAGGEAAQFLRPEDQDIGFLQERAVFAGQGGQTRLLERRFADGRPHTLRTTKFPVLDADGRIAKVGSVSVDLTDLMAAQSAARSSEARFRDFAEIASDFMWETDEAHRLKSLSDERVRALGYDPEAYIGSTRWELAGGDVVNDAFWREFRGMMDVQREFRDVEYWFDDPSGPRRCIRVSGRPLHDETGAFVGYRGVASDVTAERLAAKRLSENEALMSTVLDNMPNLITIRDLNGRIAMANRAYRSAFPLRFGDDYPGAVLEATLPPDEAAHVREIHAQVIATGETMAEEVRVEHSSEPMTALMVRFPIRDPDGRIVMIGMVGADITDRKAMELDLENAKERAEAASRAKSGFRARMSHELRTPLKAVIGFGQLLRAAAHGGLGDPAYRSYAADIVESGEYLLALVNDILDMSQIEAGEFKPNFIGCRVAEVVRSAIHLVRHAAKKPIARIVYAAASDLPNAWADQRAFRQILVNLLSNAAKFTPETGEIRLEARARGDGRIEFAVSDDGEGIGKEELQRIMEPFSTNRRQQDPYEPNRGIGLGLSIVKGLVEAHGGRIDVASEPGKGARFAFTLAADTRPSPTRRATAA
ncbi:MAG: PAS domain-containing protein, partial [Alphaproteobacteria bacterium]